MWKTVYCNIAKKELIKQNDGHFWIQGAQITLEKFLSTQQQNGVMKYNLIVFYLYTYEIIL